MVRVFDSSTFLLCPGRGKSPAENQGRDSQERRPELEGCSQGAFSPGEWKGDIPESDLAADVEHFDHTLCRVFRSARMTPAGLFEVSAIWQQAFQRCSEISLLFDEIPLRVDVDDPSPWLALNAKAGIREGTECQACFPMRKDCGHMKWFNIAWKISRSSAPLKAQGLSSDVFLKFMPPPNSHGVENRVFSWWLARPGHPVCRRFHIADHGVDPASEERVDGHVGIGDKPNRRNGVHWPCATPVGSSIALLIRLTPLSKPEQETHHCPSRAQQANHRRDCRHSSRYWILCQR